MDGSCGNFPTIMFKEKSQSYTKKSVLTSCMQTLESDIVKVEKNLYPTLIFSILKSKSAQFPNKKYEKYSI